MCINKNVELWLNEDSDTVTSLTPETTMLLSAVYAAEVLSSSASLHVSLVIVNRPARETVTAKNLVNLSFELVKRYFNMSCTRIAAETQLCMSKSP